MVRNILERVPAGDEWQRIRCKKAAATANLSVSMAFFCGVTLGNESVKGGAFGHPCLYLSWSCQRCQKINPRYTPNPLVHGILRRFTSFSHIVQSSIISPHFSYGFPMVSPIFMALSPLNPQAAGFAALIATGALVIGFLAK